MSGGVNSGIKLFFSVEQCVRNSFVKNRKSIYCQAFRASSKFSRTDAVVKFPQNVAKGSDLMKTFYQRWPGQNFIKCDRIVLLKSRSFCTQPTNSDPSKSETTDKKLSIFQKIKKMWKEYWYVIFPVHLITSVGWLGGFYYLVCSGIDIPALLLTLGAPESWVQKLKESNAGNLVLTYTLYKIATPLRYTVTVGGTTYAINFLRKMGWMPAPLKNPLSKFAGDKMAALKNRTARSQDKMQVTKEYLTGKKNALAAEGLQEAQGGISKSMSERRKVEKNISAIKDKWKYSQGWSPKTSKGYQNLFEEKPMQK